MPWGPARHQGRRWPTELIEHQCAAAEARVRSASLEPGKIAISLRIERDVIEACGVTGCGWQTRMYDSLAVARTKPVDGDPLERIERGLEHALEMVRAVLKNQRVVVVS